MIVVKEKFVRRAVSQGILFLAVVVVVCVCGGGGEFLLLFARGVSGWWLDRQYWHSTY